MKRSIDDVEGKTVSEINIINNDDDECIEIKFDNGQILKIEAGSYYDVEFNHEFISSDAASSRPALNNEYLGISKESAQKIMNKSVFDMGHESND